jgi:SAM-dependent methyltransferase
MAIRSEKATDVESRGLVFPDHPLAHHYLDGKQGVELGSASHNPFNLKGSINVAPMVEGNRDFQFYADQQAQMCGRYDLVDLYGDAQNIPVDDDSLDYVISSHVIEHVPNLIDAFLHWNQKLKSGGIVFMIFPQKGALPPDAKRNLSTIEQFVAAYEGNWDTKSALENISDTVGGERGHYHTFSLQSMLDLIEYCNQNYDLNWEILDTEETDSKVGNGHTVIARYNGPVPDYDRSAYIDNMTDSEGLLEPRDLEEGEMLEQATELHEALSEGIEVDEETASLFEEALADLQVDDEVKAEVAEWATNLENKDEMIDQIAENAGKLYEALEPEKPVKRGRKRKGS